METMDDYKEELEASFRRIREGDIISGTVIDVNEEQVTLDLRYYAPGIIKTEDISSDPDFAVLEQVHVGDVIEASVIRTDDGAGNILLSKKEANDELAWEKLQRMLEEETTVTVRIKESVKAGVAAYLPAVSGFLIEKELEIMGGALASPKRPLVAILGGSKVSSKIGVINHLLDIANVIIIGGGMTYTFAGARGGKVGKSICEPEMFPVALEILELAKQKGVQLVMSPDALICDKFAEDAHTQEASVMNIPDDWEGVDIASEGKKAFREHILGCKTILWNGPVGVFEIDKFATGSKEVAEAIAEATEKGAFSLIGGGDSVACINKFGLADRVSYISTGGGALLEYIEFGDLPGVAAIRD